MHNSKTKHPKDKNGQSKILNKKKLIMREIKFKPKKKQLE